MSHHHDAPVIHRNALRGAGLLVVISILAAAVSSWNGPPTVMDPTVPVVESRALRFEDAPGGAVVVRDEIGVVAVYGAGEGQFVRGVVRALARHRRQVPGAEDDLYAAFELQHRSDGRLALVDPVSGERIVVNAFGSENFGAFVELLRAPATDAQANGFLALQNTGENS